MGGPSSPAAVPRVPADRVAREYRRLRGQVFAGIFLGYAAYYLVRNTMALAIPDLLEAHPEYSKAMLGTAMTGLSIAYGVSKFLMGSVSDRSNPRYFLPLGLLLSSGIIFASGTMKWIYSSLLRLRVRIGRGRSGGGLDRRPLGLERRLRRDGGVPRAHDGLHRPHAARGRSR
jgi:sugar phosphate permease